MRYPYEAFSVVRLIGACGVTVQTERTPEEADVFAAFGMEFVEPAAARAGRRGQRCANDSRRRMSSGRVS